MKPTGSFSVVGPVVGALVVAALGLLLFLWSERERPWRGARLTPDGDRPPAVFFERRSAHDPGLYRVLLWLRQPLSRNDADRLGEGVVAEFDDTREPITAFARAWSGESAIEVRVPLTQPDQAGRPIRCRVGPLATNLTLQMNRSQAPAVDLREVAPSSNRLVLTLGNRGDVGQPVTAMRVNGADWSLTNPIVIPPQRHVRLVLGEVPSARRFAVAAYAGERCLEARETAAPPPFTLEPWESGSPLPGAQDGSVAPVADDFCNVERARGMLPGTYLFELKRRLAASPPSPARAGAEPAPADRSHCVFLNTANRPRSHYVYGRLTDFLGVNCFEGRWREQSVDETLFWMRLSRGIVEPAHLLAMPCVFPPGARTNSPLTEVELRRTVLACLIGGPRGILVHGRDTALAPAAPEQVASWEQWLRRLADDLKPVASSLRTGFPVPWVGTTQGSRFQPDHYGTSGYFALWSADDRLVLVSLGNDRSAEVRLPPGVEFGPSEDGENAVQLDRRGAGEARVSHRPGELPGVAVLPLRVNYGSEGRIAWMVF